MNRKYNGKFGELLHPSGRDLDKFGGLREINRIRGLRFGPHVSVRIGPKDFSLQLHDYNPDQEPRLQRFERLQFRVAGFPMQSMQS